MSSWQDISDIITRTGRKKLRVGNTLTFNYEGSLHTYKIMRMPANGHIWVRRIYLIDPADMDNHYGHVIESSRETLEKYDAPWCLSCGVPITHPAKKGGGHGKRAH